MSLSNSMMAKLSSLTDRYDEVNALLADPEVMAERERFTALSKEYAELDPVIQCFKKVELMEAEIIDARELAKDDDPEMRDLANEDISRLSEALEAETLHMRNLLLPQDPDDSSNVFLEIRAGTGGDEAALFSGDLFRMYTKFAESQGWQTEVINSRSGEHGGYKEIITRIQGKDVYSLLKFESGIHRVQRVPETESKGRLHTSACTVAVLPEAEDIESIEINNADLRVDTYRASGAGGQHVNKTDSAVRLTHLPTGIVVECQDERSQLKNRARALALLHAKLLDDAKTKQLAEQAEHRKSLVGSGDRSEKIRTYNYPQGRITDHRINFSVYKLNDVMAGALEFLVQPLVEEHQADQLRSLGEDE
ncbi:MAG: peptide chain release factor 1 [Gammaproteobacteria bacterium]|nr:MAG: peptide chain release factor 1 [Gammaproteobacteria bacterium]